MDPAFVKTLTTACIVLANFASFILMGADKLSAKLGNSRVPEQAFFVASLMGGFGGVILGMFVFHHKTSKRSFQLKIGVAAVASILLLALLGFV